MLTDEETVKVIKSVKEVHSTTMTYRIKTDGVDYFFFVKRHIPSFCSRRHFEDDADFLQNAKEICTLKGLFIKGNSYIFLKPVLTLHGHTWELGAKGVVFINVFLMSSDGFSFVEEGHLLFITEEREVVYYLCRILKVNFGFQVVL